MTMPAKLPSKAGTIIAKLALSILFFVVGAWIVKQVALAFGSTYVSPGLGYAMMVSLIIPVWFPVPIPWKIAAGAAAFIAGILTYIAGRLILLLFPTGVITNINFVSISAGAITGFSVIVSPCRGRSCSMAGAQEKWKPPKPITCYPELRRREGMIFKVRRYKGPDKPQNGYEAVEAESAQEAAEKACGEPLADLGPASKLRATVHPTPPAGVPLTYYARN